MENVKYRVVSDRRSYGVYDTEKEAIEAMARIDEMLYYNHSNEYCWIEEE